MRIQRWLVLGLISGPIVGFMAGCTAAPQVQMRRLAIEQQWQLQPGDTLAGHQIVGSLGDVSIELKGDGLYAPFDGKVQPYGANCVIFSSPQVPAYVMRFCGIQHPQLGEVVEGERIGRSEVLHWATLRRQPSGQWTMVEPSRQVIEKALR